jgi:hypothetical protein
MAKWAFFNPGKDLASFRSASGPEAIWYSSNTGTPWARRRVQPIDGLSLPVPKKGVSNIRSYDFIKSKGMLPSKE